jgi:hypothetical protein
MVYMVADDVTALKHKVITLHETAGFIAGRDTADDNPATALVRELLTRGRADYRYVERDDDGRLASKHLEAEGPIALLTTSARDNLDPEMRNRLISAPVNESQRTTRAIQLAQIAGEAAKNSREARRHAKKHRAFQRWLQAQAPIRVVIPDDLRRAILAALGELPLTVRTRRDVPAFLLAVKASAALCVAQRMKDSKGRVIAQIEDYRAAHRAIDGFLALEYSSKLKPEHIVVLAAIETLIAKDQKARAIKEEGWKAAGEAFPIDHIRSQEPKAKLSYDLVQTQLQMGSRDTLAKRIKSLKAAGAVAIERERVGKPWIWELITPAAKAQTAQSSGFMPPPEEVESFLGNEAERDAKIAELVAASGRLPDWSDEQNEKADDLGGEEDADDFV